MCLSNERQSSEFTVERNSDFENSIYWIAKIRTLDFEEPMLFVQCGLFKFNTL